MPTKPRQPWPLKSGLLSGDLFVYKHWPPAASAGRLRHVLSREEVAKASVTGSKTTSMKDSFYMNLLAHSLYTPGTYTPLPTRPN